MIKEFEYYHGAVLTKLVRECTEPITIRSFSASSSSAYVLNETIGLYIKYSTKRLTPWRFSFLKLHQDEILKMKTEFSSVFLLLVCGEDGIVTLSFEEIKMILNDVHGEIEWISAARLPNKEYTIKGSDGALARKVGKNNFPKKIFELTKGIIVNNSSPL